ncbi:efflux transporter outer membrane subunit [Altererythrobacter xixiisoli]|uniref:Efflux transporter outer membrane subunit n=1 Tax=Croceibacterium xixiisoli TaxID=1476466 RepID=A0A6I4TUZ9_9SPHN|nr:efflux transporter outer membrane subunit [Croceibacterium xixiisoli]MXO98577.1 efflux transporter outer membrane subunit [Croceibacterium xixiisoli]
MRNTLIIPAILLPPILLPPILLLGACTVGPDYAGPPELAGAAAPGAGFVRNGGDFATATPQLADWWTVLNDPVLNQLEQRALAGSPDLAVALARLNQARAALQLEKLEEMPQLGAIGTAAHIRLPGITGGEDGEGSDGTSTNFYNLGLNASWEVDLFGGHRRRMETARAQLDAADASVADARVSLTSAVAQAYLEYRDRQARLGLVRDAVAQREQLLDFIRQRFDRGVGTQSDVERAQLALENTKQQIAPLTADSARFANALAILTGGVPGAVDPLLQAQAPIPLPPANVPVGDPASLLARRPDIRVAERKIAADNAKIGLAEAARLPRLSFMGILGIGGTRPGDLVDLDDFTAIAAPMLQWNFLDFGRGRAEVNQAEAVRDESEAAWRGTVLGALRDVEDAMGNFRASRETVASQARAEAAEARLEQIEQQRFDVGTGTRPAVLEAQLARNTAQTQLSQSKAQLTMNFITLQKALGLGWTPAP